MNYKEAEAHLFERQFFGMKLGLSNTRRALKRLGNPEKSFRSVHVAGTNGKGSVSVMLASILSAAGYRTGLYTSPHISTVRERFRIDGETISEADFARLYGDVVEAARGIDITYFESTTVLAFRWFAERNVDIAVVEVGLGGRFDATNVIVPELSVITSIGYDHIPVLGDRLTGIAKEKCGIIKKDVPVVSGVTQPLIRGVIRKAARRRNARVFFRESQIHLYNVRSQPNRVRFTFDTDRLQGVEIELPLGGSFQAANAGIALAATTVLEKRSVVGPVPEESIRNGLQAVSFPDRFTYYRKRKEILIDVCHNESGFITLRREIMKLFPGREVLLIVGMKGDKDWEGSLRPVIPLLNAVYGVPVPGFEGYVPEQLAVFLRPFGIPFTFAETIESGVRTAYKKAGSGEPLVCAGSHYTIDRIKKVVNSLD